MMFQQFGIRTRLTALVALTFSGATIVGALAIMNLVEHRLVTDTKTSAENVLGSYLHNATDGSPLIAIVDPSESAAFFYLDSNGDELTQFEYFDAVLGSVPGTPAGDPTTVQVRLDGGPGMGSPGPGAGDGVVMTQGFTAAIAVVPIGQIHEVDRGPSVVGVAQRVQFPDGTQLEIGVTSPLQPVRDSLNAIRTMLWIAGPLLIATVTALTALIVGRSLRPVHSIIHRTREISDTNLSQRVPVPTGGDDISELAVTMNDMLSRLELAQQRHRQFIADASHELRSPVAASRVQLEVALAHPDQADWDATARTVLAEQTRLGILVDDLLALSRLDEQGLGIIDDVDLREVVEAETRRPHRVSTTVVIDRPAHVVGNRGQLSRAVRNVIENADRHASSHVAVSVTQQDGRAVVHVDDDGPGIPVEQREHVFDRFTRLDEPRNRNDGGAGLGLAIVAQVVTTHGGSVSCTDSPDGGARISISIPLSSPTAPGSTGGRFVETPLRGPHDQPGCQADEGHVEDHLDHHSDAR